jgi:hypothetical protein
VIVAKLGRARVAEHTRTLADGTQITVHDHSRSYSPTVVDPANRSPVEQHRRQREKVDTRERRQEAMHRARERARRAGPVIRKRGKQGLKIARKGGKRLRRAGRYAARKRRMMAAACVAGGVFEVGAGLLWSTTGVVTTSLGILASALAGGLMIGGSKRNRPSPPLSTRRRRAARRPSPGRRAASKAQRTVVHDVDDRSRCPKNLRQHADGHWRCRCHGTSFGKTGG